MLEYIYIFQYITTSISFIEMGVFMIGVPKRNDLYLKDHKGQIWIFFILCYYSCNELLHTAIDKMMFC